MENQFDPYRDWLHIAPSGRLPTHYELLGLPPFDDKPRKAHAAASERIAHVRKYQAGKHSDVAIRLMHEISQALTCLQNPAAKAAYDRELRGFATVEDAAAEALAKTAADVPLDDPESMPPLSPELAGAAGKGYEKLSAAVAAMETPPVAAAFVQSETFTWPAPATRKRSPTPLPRIPALAIVFLILLLGAYGLYRVTRDAPPAPSEPVAVRGPETPQGQIAPVDRPDKSDRPVPAPVPVPPQPSPAPDLPLFAEVVPQWAPESATAATRVREHRSATLSGLSDFAWSDLHRRMVMTFSGPMPLPGPFAPPGRPGPPGMGNSGDPLGDVPTRFVLTGNLAAVRNVAESTWVYVQFGTGRAAGAPVPLEPVAAIEFSSAKMPLLLCDFQTGEPVRVAVERTKWTVNRPPPAPASMPTQLLEKVAEWQMFQPYTSHAGVYWCFHGHGLEKLAQPETWVSPEQGRTAMLANAAVVARTAGQVLRSIENHTGAAGRIVAEYQSVQKVGSDVIVTCSMNRTSEGALEATLNLGGEASLGELVDYRPGQRIESVVRVLGAAPLSTDQPVSRTPLGTPAVPFALDPLIGRARIQLQAASIEIQGRPATRVVSSGPRRQLAAQPANQTAPGQPDVRTGKLEWLVRRDGETHFLVQATGSRVGGRYFEAYTSDASFFENVLDYSDRALFQQTADDITVEGVLDVSTAAAYRLNPLAPLLRISSVERPGNPSSRAVVGSVRDPQSFRQLFVPSGLSALYRDLPETGSQVEFEATYQSYMESRHVVRVRAGALVSRSSEIVFPNTTRSDFKDYRNNDLVEITAIVDALPDSQSGGFKLTGKSIMLKGKQQSRITDRGLLTSAPDLTVEKRRWESLRLQAAATNETLKGAGLFRSHARDSLGIKLFVYWLYGDNERLQLVCPVAPEVEQFVRDLKPDEELIFEFQVKAGRKLASGSMVSLVWIARQSDPDRRITAAAPSAD